MRCNCAKMYTKICTCSLYRAMFASINILSAFFHASPLIIHELKSIFHWTLHIKIIYCTTSSGSFISVKRCQTIRSRAVCWTNEVIHTVNLPKSTLILFGYLIQFSECRKQYACIKPKSYKNIDRVCSNSTLPLWILRFLFVHFQ